jgi:hypothetical protein
MLEQAMIVNAVVLVAVLEADLGARRKITRLRVIRPLLLAAAIVPLYLKGVTTSGVGLDLELGLGAAGILLGLAAAALMRVVANPATNRPVSVTGYGYAALWTAVIGARAAFSYGSVHWFGPQLASWMTAHAVSSAAITDSLIFMAVAMLSTRTIAMVVRSRALMAGGSPTAAVGQDELLQA